MAVVIKYGGNAMTSEPLRQAVAKDISQLALRGFAPVVVHGGGPFIKQALDQARLEHSFIRGLRVTSAKSLPIVEQTLTMLNKKLSQEIGKSVGLSGRDNSILVAKKISDGLGYVGEISQVNSQFIFELLNLQITPVISPLASDNNLGILNVNADEVAGAVAASLQSSVIFLTDVAGVLDDFNNPNSLLKEITKAQILERIDNGKIAGGMIPKVEAALKALKQGAEYAVIADGREPKILAKVIAAEAGTKIIS